jgi:hypothetical protein
LKKLFTGRLQFGRSLSGAIQSAIASRKTETFDTNSLSFKLISAMQGSSTTFFAVLSSNDLTAQTFKKWMLHVSLWTTFFKSENILEHPHADHTFSHEADWHEVCLWIGQRLKQITARR